MPNLVLSKKEEKDNTYMSKEDWIKFLTEKRDSSETFKNIAPILSGLSLIIGTAILISAGDNIKSEFTLVALADILAIAFAGEAKREDNKYTYFKEKLEEVKVRISNVDWEKKNFEGKELEDSVRKFCKRRKMKRNPLRIFDVSVKG